MKGYTIHWKNSAKSRRQLGFPETIRQLEAQLKQCHASNRKGVQQDLKQAQAGQGTTVFDWLVAIIKDHGLGGEEADDCVELILE